MRVNSNLLKRFNLIWVVQSHLQKYSASRFGRNRNRAVLSCTPQEGRIAIVTDVGCGMRWTLWRRKTGGADADGEVVWS
jgi:hypothetical protein